MMFKLNTKTNYTLKNIFTGGSSKDAEYKLAQSGDATCNGLDSAEVWIKSKFFLKKETETHWKN